ncbi:MAG: diguanylate cyclase [Epsilonproteobacteria bacterium]|nr:diguanylate cyclase [Campylobacterota bacterium]
MMRVKLEELASKNKEELITLIMQCQDAMFTASAQVHVLSHLDRLKEHPSLEAHIEKVYRNSKNVSVMMFRIYNLSMSEEIFSKNIAKKIVADATKLIKTYMRSTDILIKYSDQNFIIIAPNTDMEGIEKYAQKLFHAIYTNEFATISHLKSNFALTTFLENDSINTIVSRLITALGTIEQNTSKFTIKV